jgi:hypothetical protein
VKGLGVKLGVDGLKILNLEVSKMISPGRWMTTDT